jgi:hypothetical protein
MGAVYPKKIRVKHFQFRSPDQMERRFTTRRQATKEGYKYFGHTNDEDWRNKLSYRKELIKESPEWKSEGCRAKHMPPRHIQLIKLVGHALKIFP